MSAFRVPVPPSALTSGAQRVPRSNGGSSSRSSRARADTLATLFTIATAVAEAAPTSSPSPEVEVDDPRQRAVRLSQPRSSRAEGSLISPQGERQEHPVRSAADANPPPPPPANADEPTPRVFPATRYNDDTRLDEEPQSNAHPHDPQVLRAHLNEDAAR